MSYADWAAQGNIDYGHERAREEVKEILKNQKFIRFNINEQYSILPIITQGQMNSFLQELLDWVFQSSTQTARDEDGN